MTHGLALLAIIGFLSLVIFATMALDLRRMDRDEQDFRRDGWAK